MNDCDTVAQESLDRMTNQYATNATMLQFLASRNCLLGEFRTSRLRGVRSSRERDDGSHETEASFGYACYERLTRAMIGR